jgi:hypothetical protein
LLESLFREYDLRLLFSPKKKKKKKKEEEEEEEKDSD